MSKLKRIVLPVNYFKVSRLLVRTLRKNDEHNLLCTKPLRGSWNPFQRATHSARLISNLTASFS